MASTDAGEQTQMIEANGATFFVDSHRAIPDLFFHGYAFSGADLILGQTGATAWSEATGAELVPGLDGNYVLLRADEKGIWTVGADHRGLCHLYLYRHEDYWAISNSFTALVQRLTTMRHDLVPQLGQLAPFADLADFARSATSFATCVRGIELVPPQTQVRLTRTSAELEPIDAPAPVSDYPAALSDFLGVWQARATTLLNQDDIAFSLRLDGGVASRSVAALFAPASADGAPEALRVTARPNETDTSDLVDELALIAGFEVDRESPAAGVADADHALSAEERFEVWRRLHLGSWAHLLSPTHRPFAPGRGSIVAMGESQRHAFHPALADKTISEGAELWRERFGSEFHFEEWQQSLVAADETLADLPGAPTNAFARHHRAFRDRFRGGATSAWSLDISPLTSVELDRCTAALAPDDFARGQAMFDIGFSCRSELLFLGYDRPEDALTGAGVKALTRVEPSTDVASGSIYGSLDDMGPAQAPDTSKNTDSMLDHVFAFARRAVAADPEILDVLELDRASADLLRLQTIARNRRRRPEAQDLFGEGRAAHRLCLAASISPADPAN